MQEANRLLLVRRLAVILVIMTFSLMVLGSWVKATGSGLSCPDWPQCYGEWLPPFPSQETGGLDPNDPADHADAYTQAQILYEWGHRLLASLLGLPFLAYLYLTFTGKTFSRGLRQLPVVAGLILFIQVNLGGITVLGQNEAPLTTAHLATATLFFGVILASAMFAYLKPFPEERVLIKEEHVRIKTVYPGER